MPCDKADSATLALADWEGLNADDLRESIIAEFSGTVYERDDTRRNAERERIEVDLEGATLLLAYYLYEDYSGSAIVIYERDGRLYEVTGSHCSCYGLEEQWAPEETTWAALSMRDWSCQSYSGDVKRLIDQHVARS